MEINKTYDLELEKAIKAIKKQKAKKVLLQLPDGLNPNAIEIVDVLEEQTNAQILIYSGTCFGACDIPQDTGADLIIQLGHSPWSFTKGQGKDIKIVK